MMKHENEVGFRIFELQNRVTKPSYAKCRHTLSYSQFFIEIRFLNY